MSQRYIADSILLQAIAIWVDLLVRGEYEVLEKLDSGRHGAEFFRHAVTKYGRTLVQPPASGWEDVDVIRVGATSPPTFHVLFPLWTAESGESSLTLELVLAGLPNGTYRSDFVDVVVLEGDPDA